MPAFCVKHILHNIREYRSNINFCGDLDVSGCVSFYQNNKTKYNALLYIAFDDVNHYGVCIVCDVSKFTASSVFMLTIRQAPTELNTCPTPPHPRHRSVARPCPSQCTDTAAMAGDDW